MGHTLAAKRCRICISHTYSYVASLLLCGWSGHRCIGGVRAGCQRNAKWKIPHCCTRRTGTASYRLYRKWKSLFGNRDRKLRVSCDVWKKRRQSGWRRCIHLEDLASVNLAAALWITPDDQGLLVSNRGEGTIVRYTIPSLEKTAVYSFQPSNRAIFAYWMTGVS